jgi:PII-like signaling protein
VGDRLVSDTLLDLYGRHEIATSILVRGFEGFGLRHHLRTDNSLSLSEDLPAVAIAVDERSRIERLAEEVTHVFGSGLMTLERAQLRGGENDIMPMVDPVKVTVHLGRQQRIGRRPAFVAVCELLHRHGVDGASVVVGVDGTVQGQRRRAAFFSQNADVPALVIAVAETARLTGILPDLERLVPRPLITVERVLICKRDGALLARPRLPPDAAQDAWQKLTIYTSEAQLCDGRPIHREITRRLRRSGAAGTTTIRGVWGFSGAHHPHGDRLWQWGRRVPAISVLIDRPDRVATLFPIVDELTAAHGLVTSELVPTARHLPP